MKTFKPLIPRLAQPRLLSAIFSVPATNKAAPSPLLPKLAADCPILSSFRNNSSSTSSFSNHERANRCLSTYQDVKYGGRIIYSRTVKEVEKAAEELLDFVETKKRKEGECILGIDIEWKPSFIRGVSPGKAAVMQICGDNSCCHVLHIFHSGIPKKLRTLLEDYSSLKVGVGIANDATKIHRDYNILINNLEDLSDLANRKLDGKPKKWSLSSLTEMVICRQGYIPYTPLAMEKRDFLFIREIPKPGKIRLGNWEARVLSREQIKYAVIDAYISWYLYQVLKTHADPSGNSGVEIAVDKIT